MLEIQMEEAIANCPELFIESGLTLLRRQVVINGRRPDVLFSDGLSRHLLVEIQCGQLDESHLQRHFYYYFDYRSKYPSTHPRLMFIANRMVPRHKEFLDEHGYEFKEIPEEEFGRKANDCALRSHQKKDEVEIVTTPGVLAPFTYELLYEIETQPMTFSYKMLLLMFMAQKADSEGRVLLSSLAEEFQYFFIKRSIEHKPEENPNRIKPGALAQRTASEWARVIRDQPVRYLTEAFVVEEGSSIRWAPRIWSRWDAELKHEVYAAAFDRLHRYFDRHAGGF